MKKLILSFLVTIIFVIGVVSLMAQGKTELTKKEKIFSLLKAKELKFNLEKEKNFEILASQDITKKKRLFYFSDYQKFIINKDIERLNPDYWEKNDIFFYDLAKKPYKTFSIMDISNERVKHSLQLEFFRILKEIIKKQGISIKF